MMKQSFLKEFCFWANWNEQIEGTFANDLEPERKSINQTKADQALHFGMHQVVRWDFR